MMVDCEGWIIEMCIYCVVNGGRSELEIVCGRLKVDYISRYDISSADILCYTH